MGCVLNPLLPLQKKGTKISQSKNILLVKLSETNRVFCFFPANLSNIQVRAHYSIIQRGWWFSVCFWAVLGQVWDGKWKRSLASHPLKAHTKLFDMQAITVQFIGRSASPQFFPQIRLRSGPVYLVFKSLFSATMKFFSKMIIYLILFVISTSSMTQNIRERRGSKVAINVPSTFVRLIFCLFVCFRLCAYIRENDS